eukprot:scaffold1021_cov241-Pinguiococcus_pyrenoidosus.AAC.10
MKQKRACSISRRRQQERWSPSGAVAPLPSLAFGRQVVCLCHPTPTFLQSFPTVRLRSLFLHAPYSKAYGAVRRCHGATSTNEERGRRHGQNALEHSKVVGDVDEFPLQLQRSDVADSHSPGRRPRISGGRLDVHGNHHGTRELGADVDGHPIIPGRQVIERDLVLASSAEAHHDPLQHAHEDGQPARSQVTHAVGPQLHQAVVHEGKRRGDAGRIHLRRGCAVRLRRPSWRLQQGDIARLRHVDGHRLQQAWNLAANVVMDASRSLRGRSGSRVRTSTAGSLKFRLSDSMVNISPMALLSVLTCVHSATEPGQPAALRASALI